LLTGEIDWAQDEWNALSDVATLEVLSNTKWMIDRVESQFKG